MPGTDDRGRDRTHDERESGEPREPDREKRENHEKPGEDTEEERVDREAAETFPASDPPANY
jgi:hypothetical protein